MDQTHISYAADVAGEFFTISATWEVPQVLILSLKLQM